ncbi:hypothetical protein CR513_23728, partial [Mucuna pruriens]
MYPKPTQGVDDQSPLNNGHNYYNPKVKGESQVDSFYGVYASPKVTKAFKGVFQGTLRLRETLGKIEIMECGC